MQENINTSQRRRIHNPLKFSEDAHRPKGRWASLPAFIQKTLAAWVLAAVFLICPASIADAGEIMIGYGSDDKWMEEITEAPLETEPETEYDGGWSKAVPAPFSIRICFDDTYEILTERDTADWRRVRSDGVYLWDYDKIWAYFMKLKEKYDTTPGEVRFTTHKGVKKIFKSSHCGWEMNIEISAQRFEEAVNAGEDEVDPAWNSGCVYSSSNDVGSKYVEISISEQKVFLFEDGKLVLESDCVTGTKDYTETERGVFQVIYKSAPSVLKDTDKNGYSYEQPVDFWICFNGSQGMHDASWRSEFGGSIYETWGSHGCVNLPREAAEKIYQEVYTYYPVVVY